jgi:hypothetical protein
VSEPATSLVTAISLSGALPLFSILSCFVLMLGLPLETWVRFFVWLIVGLIVYYFFGRKYSALRAENIGRG